MLIIVTILQVIVGVVLAAMILLQSGKSRGLSGAIAGSSDSYLSKGKAKTIDAKLAKGTKYAAVVFVVASLLMLFF